MARAIARREKLLLDQEGSGSFFNLHGHPDGLQARQLPLDADVGVSRSAYDLHPHEVLVFRVGVTPRAESKRVLLLVRVALEASLCGGGCMAVLLGSTMRY